MAASFNLDTSGEIDVPLSAHYSEVTRWTGLDTFTQGYVEAAFASLPRWAEGADPVLPVPAPEGSSPRQVTIVGFRHLAPATLAEMMADCERATNGEGTEVNTEGGGRLFWKKRQEGFVYDPRTTAGRLARIYPPLTLYLGDDGLIHSSPSVARKVEGVS